MANVQLERLKKSSLGEDSVDKIILVFHFIENTRGHSVTVSLMGKTLSLSLHRQTLQNSGPLGHFGMSKGKHVSPVVSNMSNTE